VIERWVIRRRLGAILSKAQLALYLHIAQVPWGRGFERNWLFSVTNGDPFHPISLGRISKMLSGHNWKTFVKVAAWITFTSTNTSPGNRKEELTTPSRSSRRPSVPSGKPDSPQPCLPWRPPSLYKP